MNVVLRIVTVLTAAPTVALPAQALDLRQPGTTQFDPLILAQAAPSANPIESLVQAARQKLSTLTAAQRDANRQVFANAFTLFQRGDFESARRGFELGLGIDPGDASAQYYLAETLVRLKDMTSAREHYEMARALTPGSIEGLQAATALERIVAKERESAECMDGVARFIDLGGGMLRQCGSQLEWTQADNGSDVNWGDAGRWCAQRGEGFRLPTSDELMPLADESGDLAKCGRSECKVSWRFRLTNSLFWSSDRKSDGEAWVVELGIWHDRYAYSQSDSVNKRALCVRRASQ